MTWLDQHPKTKKVLVISAKHAVNAVLTNGGLAALFPKVFNFHDIAGFLSFGKAFVLCVVAREALVWGPKILKWSTTGLEEAENGSNSKSDSASAGR